MLALGSSARRSLSTSTDDEAGKNTGKERLEDVTAATVGFLRILILPVDLFCGVLGEEVPAAAAVSALSAAFDPLIGVLFLELNADEVADVVGEELVRAADDCTTAEAAAESLVTMGGRLRGLDEDIAPPAEDTDKEEEKETAAAKEDKGATLGKVELLL